MQIQSHLCTGSWDWTICLFRMTVCSDLLLKPARRWRRIISGKFKSQKSRRESSFVIVANIDSVSKPVWHQSREELHWNQTSVCITRVPLWAKTGDFWRWEVRRQGFTEAQASQNHILASFDKGKTLLACSCLCLLNDSLQTHHHLSTVVQLK